MQLIVNCIEDFTEVLNTTWQLHLLPSAQFVAHLPVSDAAIMANGNLNTTHPCPGQSLKMSVTASDTPGMQTAAVTLPEGCHISEALQGLERSTAAAAEAAAAMLCLQKLQGQGLLAGYWSSAALLQQAGVEGPWEGGDPGSDAVLWRCEVCGVPATSARNLEVELSSKLDCMLTSHTSLYTLFYASRYCSCHFN